MHRHLHRSERYLGLTWVLIKFLCLTWHSVDFLFSASWKSVFHSTRLPNFKLTELYVEQLSTEIDRPFIIGRKSISIGRTHFSKEKNSLEGELTETISTVDANHAWRTTCKAAVSPKPETFLLGLCGASSAGQSAPAAINCFRILARLLWLVGSSDHKRSPSSRPSAHK